MACNPYTINASDNVLVTAVNCLYKSVHPNLTILGKLSNELSEMKYIHPLNLTSYTDKSIPISDTMLTDTRIFSKYDKLNTPNIIQSKL